MGILLKVNVMALHPDTRKRLNVDISEKQDKLLSKYIPWGLKNAIFSILIDDLLSLLEDEETRTLFISIILSKRAKDPYLSTLREVKEQRK